MAGVTKQKASQFWQAIFYDGHGNKIRRTTKLTNRKEAQRLADQWEDLEKAGAQGRLVEAQARKVVSEILERHTGEPLHFHTVRGWFDEWLAGKTDAVEKRTLARYRQIIREFLAHLGPRADLTIAGVTVKDARSFRDKLRASGRSATTVNQLVRHVLATPFIAAKNLGYIQTNPCVAVEPLQERQERGREPFTMPQLADLLRAADAEWQGVILAGFYTSMRMADITNLDRAQITGDVLRLTPSKTKRSGKVLTIPLHPEFLAWLKDRLATGKLFPSLAGKPTGGKTGLSNLFGAIMEKAGVQGQSRRTGGGKGRKTNSLTFHSLRHSMISALANAGVSSELRQKLSGHADDKSHAIYTHHELEKLRLAVNKLPRINKDHG
jgi:integrase